ncbi:o-succinylbenzoate synthase [Eudoraea sp.]|uniref:o-succinylbenzoate synthase n=1 Tax=Eudoraea sp. TaxID=1979955 RepID=UPI003C750946
MKAYYKKYDLNFKIPGGTSRGVITTKETWLLLIYSEGRYGIGECGLFRGLSVDDVPEYEKVLKRSCSDINLGFDKLYATLEGFPSIQFGLEQAFLSLESKDPFEIFPSKFTTQQDAIKINGLIWMGEIAFMKRQIAEKLEEGFNCIKIKIGALDFEAECNLLAEIRKTYPASQIELRLDANGAFLPEKALGKLEKLATYNIHSIEQPIRQGNIQEMKFLCKNSPIPIALDEELIGIRSVTEKQRLLQIIAPQFIILKPSLLGGFKASEEWIKWAEGMNIGWWVTSALESNIGLNAIAQWTYVLNNGIPQGLGTGKLYTNNFHSPLDIKNGNLIYGEDYNWNFNYIKKLCL